MSDDNKAVIADFKEAVNMSPKELEKWLTTNESKEVGQKESEGSESTGHQSGRHIVELLHKKQSDYSDDDIDQMKRVVSYVHRHLKQKPAKESIEDSRWRYSLMNWGHDPTK